MDIGQQVKNKLIEELKQTTAKLIEQYSSNLKITINIGREEKKPKVSIQEFNL